jgi:hypothetical protein
MSGLERGAAPTWSLRGLARAAGIAAVSLAAGAAAGYAVSHEPAPPGPGAAALRADRPRAGAAERAIMAPLREGSPLAEGFAIEHVDAVRDGVLAVGCRKGDARVRLDVALAAVGGPQAPATAGPYAVYYATFGATQAEGERLAVALAGVLATHSALPVPAGLGPFTAH